MAKQNYRDSTPLFEANSNNENSPTHPTTARLVGAVHADALAVFPRVTATHDFCVYCALALTKGRADALAIGSILHYNKSNIKTIKSYLDKSGFEVRPQSVPA